MDICRCGLIFDVDDINIRKLNFHVISAGIRSESKC